MKTISSGDIEMKLAGLVLSLSCAGVCGAQYISPGSTTNYASHYDAMVANNQYFERLSLTLLMQANNMARMRAIRMASLASMQQAAAASKAKQQQDESQQTPAPQSPLAAFRPTQGVMTWVEKAEPSVPAGPVKAGTQIKLNTPTHYSVLYYTTDGWTPTTQSAKYVGPLTINDTTHLQFIAVGPNMMRSPLNKADYTVDGSKVAEVKPVRLTDGILHAGTPLRVEIAGKEVNSKEASVGDKLAMVLAQDVMDGDRVFAPKGTEVTAVLTVADKKSGGYAGDLVFEVQSMTVAGKVIPLSGSETMEGESKKEAIITPGMALTALVGVDVAVK